MINELRDCNEQIKKLKNDLESVADEQEFANGLSEELSSTIRVMRDQLVIEWSDLRSIPMELAQEAWLSWVDHVSEVGVDNLDLSISDFIQI